MTNQTTAQVADSGYPELPEIDVRIVEKSTHVAVVSGNRVLGSFTGPEALLHASMFSGAFKSAEVVDDRSSRLNGGGAASLLKELLEAYEAPYPTASVIGERQATIDAQNAWGKRQGVAVNRAKAFLDAAAQASPILPASEVDCLEIARSTGLREAMHGVNSTTARSMLKRFSERLLASAAPQLPAPEGVSGDLADLLDAYRDETRYFAHNGYVKFRRPEDIRDDIDARIAALATPQPPAAQQAIQTNDWIDPISGHIATEQTTPRYRQLFYFDAPPVSQQSEQRCTGCDGTGDVHTFDGEWRGTCFCPIGEALQASRKAGTAARPVLQQSEHGGQVAEIPTSVFMNLMDLAESYQSYWRINGDTTEQRADIKRRIEALVHTLSQADATPAPVVRPEVSVDGFLCTAWGETDKPCAQVMEDMAGVSHFMVREWLGDKDATDFDGEKTLPSVMAEIDGRDWAKEGPWKAEFEIGGISVTPVYSFRNSATPIPAALKPAEAVQAMPPMDEELLYILGTICYQAIPLVKALRMSGQIIKNRAEDEQAAAIYWMLSMYLKHGKDWRFAAIGEIDRIKATYVATTEQTGGGK